MITAPFFSLIFVNFRSVRHLEEALQGLFAQEDESLFEVLVVNNDPEEARTLSLLRERWPTVRLRESGKNKGFSAGANLGARDARGEVIGFLNPDVLWRKPLLTSLKDTFTKEKVLGVAGLQLLTEKLF